MDLLKQCQQWFEQNELQKVIDALEAIPAGSVPQSWTANWPRHTSPLQKSERQDGRFMKRLWSFWLPMRSILPKITAGIIGSLPLIIFWMRKAPPCVTLKRP